jgi:hypothetical protein
VEVAAVSTTLTLEQNAEEVDFDELRQRLATLYNVPASTIRLGLSGGSVVIVLEIVATNASESSAIASAVAATTSDSLTSVLGSVAVISSVQQVVRNETIRRNQTLELQLDCPVGHWCTAGLVVECEFGFYNPTRNANNQTACLPCPEQSTTLTAAASSADQCICVVGYYNAQLPSANESSGVTCSPCKNAIQTLSSLCGKLLPSLPVPNSIRTPCQTHLQSCAAGPIGTECVGLGVTLATLPVRRGYYRASIHSTNVVRCSDSGVGCDGSNECANSTSGCRGGPDFGLICEPSLHGIYCELCDSSYGGGSNRSDGTVINGTNTRFYYVSATTSTPAHCKECGDTGFNSAGMILGVLLGVAALITFTKRAMRRLTTIATRERIEKWWHLFSIATKLKM